MRLGIIGLIFISLALFVFGAAASCENGNEKANRQRDRSIETRAQMFDRAEAKIPIPRTINFPLRSVLAEYTRRQDLINHPWYTYILSDTGQVTHYFVSTSVPVNSCAFLSSTEDIVESEGTDLVLTAPSLDGIFYGGAGAAAACDGWIFIDAASGAMGMAFGTKIMTFDSALILETEPILIRPAKE